MYMLLLYIIMNINLEYLSLLMNIILFIYHILTFFLYFNLKYLFINIFKNLIFT